MPRIQFSIRTLLWLMLVVAAFFAGMRFGEWRIMHVPPRSFLQLQSHQTGTK